MKRKLYIVNVSMKVSKFCSVQINIEDLTRMSCRVRNLSESGSGGMKIPRLLSVILIEFYTNRVCSIRRK